MLDALFNKERAIYNTIQVSLESLSEELNCSCSELFIMIKPTDERGNFKMWVFLNSVKVREITLEEIIGD